MFTKRSSVELDPGYHRRAAACLEKLGRHGSLTRRRTLLRYALRDWHPRRRRQIGAQHLGLEDPFKRFERFRVMVATAAQLSQKANITSAQVQISLALG